MTIDYQALREAAERAIPAMERLLMLPVDDDLLSEQELKDYGVDIDALNAFKFLTGPETVLALLDERERNLKYIKSRDQENEDIALTVGRLRVELEAEPVAWKATFTQIDHEYNTFTAMYSDKAEAERWVRLHKVGDFRAEITPLYAAPSAPVIPDGWISCSERMPNEEDVLVYCSDTKEQMVGFHKGKGLFQFFYMNGVEGVCEPSHWMPLPEPPQEVNRG